MDKMEKDELGEGYSLDDFGLSFNENTDGIKHNNSLDSKQNSLDSLGLENKIKELDLEKLRKSHSYSDLHKLSSDSESQINNSHDYAPQFQGFDFSNETYAESSTDLETNTDFSVETDTNTHPIDFVNDVPKVADNEKEAILQPLAQQIDKQSEIGALFVAYAILFFVLILFMPQVYLANNIYYASKNINYLKSQREALRDENGDLQQKLESLKFNFLTLEIEEIK